MNNRAVFLDRDGTLNEEAGYITSLDQFRLHDCAYEAVRLINEAEWLAIVLTNQSGIARGYFSEEFLQSVHSLMRDNLERKGARIDAIYYCPHHPELGEPPYRRDCDCRKPRPGLIEMAARDFDLRLEECFVVGDRYRDISTGHAAGVPGVMVMTGFGRDEFEAQRESWPRQPAFIAGSLLEAVKWILRQSIPG
jgi:D-glycero-D-manno-heptose 1,7-bisphosphate phosphatase